MKAILVLWLGIYQTYVERFDSLSECQAAAAALLAYSTRYDGKCVPYEAGTSLKAQIPKSH